MKHPILTCCLLAAALCLAACAPLHAQESPLTDPSLAAAPAPKTFLAPLSAASYGTINCYDVDSGAELGAGISLELRLSKRIGLRLSAEADTWKPDDYFLDRAWMDLKAYAPLSPSVSLYGFGGFGYSREGEDILARAGGGIEMLLLKLDRFNMRLFFEGSLQSSTGDYRAAGLAGGVSIGF